MEHITTITPAGLARYISVTGRSIFDKIASLSQSSGQNGIIFVVCVLVSMRISSISKVTIVHKSTTVAIDKSLTSTVFCFVS